MPMKYLLSIIAVLVLLAACAPQAPSVPAVQPEIMTPEPVVPVEETGSESAGGTTESVQEPAPNAMPEVSGPVVHEVLIEGFRYYPAELTVKAGDTVRWTNKDKAKHDASGDGWNTELLSKDQSGEYTFETQGEYDYICSVHPSMKAKVVVE